MKKKVLSLLLAMLMVLSTVAILPMTAFAGDDPGTELTASEAATIAAGLEHNIPSTTVYSVTGYVTKTDGTISKGQQVFWLDDEKGDKKTFEGYWCTLPANEEPLRVGDRVTIVGKIMRYNSTYEMKNGDVTILERVPSITNGTPEGDAEKNHGYITIDKTSAAEGDTVTVEVHPATGYQLKSLTVTPTGFVDLGIKDAEGKPLYWKETNLGASNPQDPGDYYMWGATALIYSAVDRSKTDDAFTIVTENPYGGNYKNTWDATKGFNWNNVPFADGVFKNADGERNVFTKYTTIDKYAKSGTPDNITTLQPKDDAATAKNENWRMPTKDEFAALATNCVLVWTDNYNSTGNAGYIVYKAKNDADKGKANMNGTWKMWDAANSKYIANTGSEPTGYSSSDIHIFLPAAGRGSDNGLATLNTGAGYWSGTLSSNNYAAYCLTAMKIGISLGESQRQLGYSIRPVMSFSGITPAKQTDGTYQFTMPGYAVTVTAEFEEACITTWSALQDAIDEAPGDATTPATETTTIKLTEDLTAPAEGGASINIPVGKNITLDLGGHVLNANGGKFSVIHVDDGVQLTLIDSAPTTEHYFTVGDDGLWTLTDTKTENTKTVKGGVITGGRGTPDSDKWSYGGGVFIDNQDVKSTFTMNGGTICGNTATYGGGVLLFGEGNANDTVFNMNGGTVCGNTAEYGGGVFILTGLVYLGGTTVIKDNFADRNESNLVVWNRTILCGLYVGTKTGSEEGNGVLKPADGMNVGVTLVDGDTVDKKNVFSPTSGKILTPYITADDLKYFFSDSADYNLGVDTGKPIRTNDDYLLLNEAPGVSAWADLQSAINETSGDATTPATGTTNIKLTGDLTAPAEGGASIIIPEGKNITLDLNGHVLNANGGYFSVINVKQSGTLTLIDSVPTTEHYFTVGDDGLWTLTDTKTETTKTVNGGVITGGIGDMSGGVYVSSNGVLNMLGGNIVGNMGSYGGGVNVNRRDDSIGVFTMNGGTICGNMSDYVAGGVDVLGIFTMNGGTICDNTCDNHGGGVYNSGSFEMKGGTISGNTTRCGGGVYNDGSFTMENGSITGNTASFAEGGIANRGTMSVSGKVIIKDNICTQANNPINLATKTPINVDGALTGSEIYITHVDFASEEHDLGVLTSGFTTKNEGAKLGDFFTYDGSSNFVVALNDSGELEVKAIPHTHTGVKQNGQPATETAAGYKDYYKCDCGLYFEEEVCTTLIGDDTALATWKAEGGNGYVAPNGAGDPEPGDDEGTNLWWLWVLIAVVVVGGGFCVWFFFIRKKDDNGPKGPDAPENKPAPVAPVLTPEEKAARAEEKAKAAEAAWIAEAQQKLAESPIEETEDENGTEVIGVLFQKRAWKIYWFKYDGTDFAKGEIASYTADDGKQYKVMVAIPKIRKDMSAHPAELKTLQKNQ